MYYFCTKKIFLLPTDSYFVVDFGCVRRVTTVRYRLEKETKKVNGKQVFFIDFILRLLSSPPAPAGFATGRMPIFWRGMHEISGDFIVTLFTVRVEVRLTLFICKKNQSDQGLQHPPPLDPVGELDPGEDGYAGGLPGNPVWELRHYSVWDISGGLNVLYYFTKIPNFYYFFAICMEKNTSGIIRSFFSVPQNSWTTTPTPLTRPATPASWRNPSTGPARRCSS